MKVTVNEVKRIDWGFITHDEREEILYNNESITNIQMNEFGYNTASYSGYIESVEAWIDFTI